MKKTLILLGAAAVLALPAAAAEKKYFKLPTFTLPSAPSFLLEKTTPIDAEFTALVREVEIGRVRTEKWNSIDKLAQANEQQDIDDLKARLDRDAALSKDEKLAAIEQARQAIRQRYAQIKAEWRAPEPAPEVLAAVAPVYASYYSLPRMRELRLAFNPPLDGRTVEIKGDALDSLARVNKQLAKARSDAMARRLDAMRVAASPAR